MRLRVLGSAAGGGFPQWNCGCANCDGVRRGSIRATARRQESVAICSGAGGGEEGERWFVLNVSPEIRAQVESFSGLWPKGRRQSPMAGLVLTNGDLDHCLGLLSLRESFPLNVYATAEVWRGFTEANVLFRTLERFPGQITWHPIELGREQRLSAGTSPSSNDDAGDLRMTAFAVTGKRPIHLENVGTPGPEDNIGLLIRPVGPGPVVAYVPAAARWTAELEAQLSQADTVFFDGTFWSSAEMSTSGVGDKRAEDMAHLPIGGPEGSLERIKRLPARRKIFIHINNTNPILREDSAERAQVQAAGVEVAHDDMDVTL